MSDDKRRTVVELFVLSAVSLFVELLIIRWMSGDIRAFTVFKTFPLICCFVGLGVGFALKRDVIFRWTPLLIIAFAVMMKVVATSGISHWGFPSFSVYQWQDLLHLDYNVSYMLWFVVLIVLLLIPPFALCVAIGSRLGILFSQMEPLPAYSYNVLGAIVGSIIFPVLCFLGWSPWQLFTLSAAIVLIFVWGQQQKFNLLNAVAVLLLPVMFLMFPERPNFTSRYGIGYEPTGMFTTWSPYQRVDCTVWQKQPTDGSAIAVELGANRLYYQLFVDFKEGRDTPFAKTIPFDNIKKDCEFPFQLKEKPQSVLIAGAGVGVNVLAAADLGVPQIDAVEIDPVILDVGRKYNRTYKLPAVNLICDDARHFFSECQKKYDVINFSAVDSHTVSGLGSSVRVDAYLYTKESIARALQLLKDDGIIVLAFATVAPWSENRLYETIKAAAGYEPLVIEGKYIKSTFILGESVKNKTLKAPEGFNVKNNSEFGGERLLTDDWPYLYVNTSTVDYPYLFVVLEVLALSVFAARKYLFAAHDRTLWQMFFLGSAFLLLELHAISFLSLLYGSTWITSAVVINGILIMILAANVFILKAPPAIANRQSLFYGLLVFSILLSYFFPSQDLLSSSGASVPIYALVTLVTILPMGMAALVFASSFSRVSDSARAIAFNLFGAVVGGLLEYLSNYIGIRNLELVALGLYLASLLCSSALIRSNKTEATSL